MLIRKLFFVFLGLLLGTVYTNAQNNKMYVEYNNDCMTRMEYKAMGQAQSGNKIHYYVQNVPNTRLILELRKGNGVRMNAKPGYVQPCSRIQYNENLMMKVNTGEIDLYVVSRDKNGYMSNYVESISIIKDYTNSLSFNSFTYGFKYQKNALDPTTNMAANVDADDVMYRGETGYNCLTNYTFRHSTKNTCGTYTDVTFSPKLGVLKMTEFENPQFSNGSNEILKDYQLLYINNLPVDNFLGSYCQGRTPKDPTLYVAPTVIPDEFASRGSDIVIKPTTPIIATTPKPTPAPQVVKPQVLPKNNSKDFTNGIQVGSEYGEPVVPVTNYVAECNAYKRKGYHIVRPKESLYSISRMTGISMDNLADWNAIENRKVIPACSELRLTPPTPDMYDALTLKSDFIQKDAKAPVTKKKEEVKKSSENEILVAKGEAKKVNKKPATVPEIEGIHIVQDGETLYSIAKKYGYTAEKFMKINELESDIISPNMVLKTTDCACEIPEDYTPKGTDTTPKGGEIPANYEATISKLVKEDGVTHVLKEGETLYQISKKYDVSVERLMLLNKVKDPKDLSIGQELFIK